MIDEQNQDNKKIFEQLFTTYYSRIKKFLTGFLDSPEEGEDLAQDVFVKLWQNRSSIVYIENVNAYLYRMAKNILYDYIEKSKKQYHKHSSVLPEIPTTETIEDLIFADELRDLINLKIKQMPPQRKAIFTMSREEGLSNQEIADQLNISKRTVETHISAALADIRKILPLLILFF